MIWLIVPFSRPAFAANVVANYRRQSIYARLVWVHNGPARGEALETPGEHLESESGLAEPMNAGLAYVRKKGAPTDWFCKWDDDDYYGPDYVRTVIDGIERGADIVGRSAAWVRTETERLWFIEGLQNQWSNDLGFHGPTLASAIDCPNFPLVDEWGEDFAWLNEMAAAGRSKRWHSSAHDFCWMRRGPEHGHAFPFSAPTLAGMQAFNVYDCGPFLLETTRTTSPRFKHIVRKPEDGEQVERMFDEMHLARSQR